MDTQISLITLYPKSLIENLKYANDVRLTREAKTMLNWVKYHEKVENESKTYRHFDISRTIFYKWFIESIDYHVDHLNALLRRYIEKYNFIRLHYILGYRIPGELVYPDKENKSKG